MSYQYKDRTFETPIDWEIPFLVTDVITNDILNNLYPFFSCSAGQIMSENIQAQKKGIVNPFPKSLWYLQEGLYTLRNWYNGGYSFPILTDESLGNSISIWYAVSTTDNSESVPLAINVSTTGNLSALIIALNLALPSGWIATLTGMQVYLESVNALQQYIYVVNSNNVTTESIWSTIDFWSCIPYSVMQNIVQNMTKICNCPNCGNTILLETDNIYVSLSQPIPNPVSMFITSIDNPLYN